MTKILSALFKELLAFVVIELLVRASVGLGLVSLPSMSVGWFDRLRQGDDPPVEKRLFEADRDLIFRMRAATDFVYPRTVLQSNKPQTWSVHTNEQGFRSPPFSEAKPAGVFRIVCLGDSSTFGMNVDDADAYPRVLARLLEERSPGRFEVLNLGVPGYSSRQGLELLRQSVLRYQPDLVTFAFGTNDRFWRRSVSDDQVIRFNQSLSGTVLMYLRNAAEHLYSYRLLRRLATTAAVRLFGIPALQKGEPLVSLPELAGNIVAAQTLLRANGAAMLVLNNDFYGTDAIAGMREGARPSGVPVLDMRQLFLNRERQRSRELEAQHHLSPPEPPQGMMLFRVWTRAPEEQLAVDVRAFEPQATRFLMRDDGRSGDQVAGDGVWSSLVPAARTPRVEYTYWKRKGAVFVREYGETISGTSARLRSVAAAGNIDTLGELYLHTDSAHPDEEGHALIANALVERVLRTAPGP